MSVEAKEEIWDAYTRDGAPAGRELIRGKPIPEGLYHLVSDVLVRHTDGEYLLMERDRSKHYGGRFEATAGGSALRGEDALGCAKRELWEETGIVARTLEPIGRYTSHDTIYFQFLCVTDCDKNAVSLQEGETASFRWVSEDAFRVFIHDGMIDRQRVRYTYYFAKMGYI